MRRRPPAPGAEARRRDRRDAARAHQDRTCQGAHVRLGTVGDARAPHGSQAPRHGQSFFARFLAASQDEETTAALGVRRVDGVGAGQRHGVDQ